MNYPYVLNYNANGAPTVTQNGKVLDHSTLPVKCLYPLLEALYIMEPIKNLVNTKDFLLMMMDKERYPNLLRVPKASMPSRKANESTRKPVGGDREWCQNQLLEQIRLRANLRNAEFGYIYGQS